MNAVALVAGLIASLPSSSRSRQHPFIIARSALYPAFMAAARTAASSILGMVDRVRIMVGRQRIINQS